MHVDLIKMSVASCHTIFLSPEGKVSPEEALFIQQSTKDQHLLSPAWGDDFMLALRRSTLRSWTLTSLAKSHTSLPEPASSTTLFSTTNGTQSWISKEEFVAAMLGGHEDATHLKQTPDCSGLT